MQWITTPSERKCWGREDMSDLAIVSKCLWKGLIEKNGWAGIHIHLLPELASIPLYVMAVYNITEQEK